MRSAPGSSRIPGLRTLLLAGVAAWPGVAGAQDLGDVTGQAGHAARIALPDDAVLTVAARGLRDALLDVTTRPTGGAQVPLDFALSIPAGVTARINVTILAHGSALWHAAPVAVAPGQGAVNLGLVMLDPGAAMTGAALYLCGDTDVTFGMVADQFTLLVDGARYPVDPVPAASGTRFAAADPGTFFWSRGEAALVSVAGQTLPECAALPAVYTARGNDPDWSLIVAGQDLAAYRLIRRDAPEVAGRFPAAVWTDGAAVWDARPDGPLVRMHEVLCHDSMTAMPYPEQVEVTMDEEVVTGCGGDPRDLLTGTDWHVEDIAGAGLIDGARVTLAFDLRGRVFGSSGCNTWFSGYALTGEGLDIGPAASTRMACAPALMEQETQFLAALEGIAGFDIDATGALRLLSGDGTTLITARRD